MPRSLHSRNFCLSAALCLIFGIAVAQDAIPLEPGKPVEREIAGERADNFQLSLVAGQFIRVTVEQKTIDVALVLLGPDGKQLVEYELTGALSQESLSHVSDPGGDYKLIIRPVNKLAPAGVYRVQLEVRTAATSQDRQRIAAERLLVEAKPAADKGGESTQGAIEKYQSALGLWREVGDRYWEARTINAIGSALNRLNRSAQAIGYFEQSLAITRELKDQAGLAWAITLSRSTRARERLNLWIRLLSSYENSRIGLLKDKHSIFWALFIRIRAEMRRRLILSNGRWLSAARSRIVVLKHSLSATWVGPLSTWATTIKRLSIMIRRSL